jgi:hypothetical protein
LLNCVSRAITNPFWGEKPGRPVNKSERGETRTRNQRLKRTIATKGCERPKDYQFMPIHWTSEKTSPLDAFSHGKVQSTLLGNGFALHLPTDIYPKIHWLFYYYIYRLREL